MVGRRSGKVKAANGVATLLIVVVGRIDVAGAVEVEPVGAAAVRVRGRRPVVAVVAGVGEQVAGTLIDVAAPQTSKRMPEKKSLTFDINRSLYRNPACRRVTA